MTGLLHDHKGKSYKIGEGITPDILVDLNVPKDIKYDDLKSHILNNKEAYLNKAIELLENK